jgi:hypothetical protein
MCVLDLNTVFATELQGADPGTWSELACPVCPAARQNINNPGNAGLTGSQITTDNITPGCYTFGYDTGANICDGCDACAEYSLDILPGISAADNNNITVPCLDIANCNTQLFLAAYLNCNSEDRLLDGGACVPATGNEVFTFNNPGPTRDPGLRWRGHDPNGIIPFAGSYNENIITFPDVVFCDGTDRASYEARITVTPSIAIQYFVGAGAPYDVFNFCDYVRETGNTSVQFTWRVRPSDPGYNCPDDCEAEHTLTVDFTEAPPTVPNGGTYTQCIAEQNTNYNVQLGNIWPGGLPAGGTFSNGDCNGGNLGGPSVDPNTGLVVFTCAHVGNTYFYNYEVSNACGSECGQIEITIVEAPQIDDNSWEFCRSSNAANSVTLTQVSGTPTLVQQGAGVVRLTIAQIQALIYGVCTMGQYTEPTTGYTNTDFDLGNGDCGSEVTVNQTITVENPNAPFCEDSGDMEILASPVYGTPNPDPAVNDLCVANCGSVDVQQAIEYSAAQVAANRDCLLNASNPLNTDVQIFVEWREPGTIQGWTPTALYPDPTSIQVGDLASMDFCDEFSNSGGCIEIRMLVRFVWGGISGNENYDCHEVELFYQDPLNICLQPTAPPASNATGCNEL